MITMMHKHKSQPSRREFLLGAMQKMQKQSIAARELLLRIEEANVAKRIARLTGKILDSGAVSECLELPVASSSTTRKIIARTSACQVSGLKFDPLPKISFVFRSDHRNEFCGSAGPMRFMAPEATTPYGVARSDRTGVICQIAATTPFMAATEKIHSSAAMAMIIFTEITATICCSATRGTIF